jgi:hypothetical protein
MFKKFQSFLLGKSQKEIEYEYLSNSSSLENLEYRQILIQNGEAPFQLQELVKLESWA